MNNCYHTLPVRYVTSNVFIRKFPGFWYLGILQCTYSESSSWSNTFQWRSFVRNEVMIGVFFGVSVWYLDPYKPALFVALYHCTRYWKQNTHGYIRTNGGQLSKSDDISKNLSTFTKLLLFKINVPISETTCI